MEARDILLLVLRAMLMIILICVLIFGVLYYRYGKLIERGSKEAIDGQERCLKNIRKYTIFAAISAVLLFLIDYLTRP